MSIEAVTGRIQEIESALAGLSAPRTATSTTSGADFAAAMVRAAGRTTGGPSGVATAAGAAGGAPGATATGGAGASADAQAVIASAKKYLGVPYLWGGTDPRKGLDCSGFTQLAFKENGVDIPRVSRDQARAGRPVASMAEARPGDLLAFNSPVSHIAIYLGNGKMIESPRTGLKVRIADVPETPSAIRRVLPDAPVGASVRTGGGSLSGVPYAPLFKSAGARYGVDPTLLAAIAKQESGFRADAVSPAGARGLMQLMPGTARGLGVDNSMDPKQAVDGAARLVKDLLRDFGRVDLALAAYNAGPGAVRRYDGIPPYAETQNYVRKVMANQARYS